jgi:hypothetical protein
MLDMRTALSSTRLRCGPLIRRGNAIAQCTKIAGMLDVQIIASLPPMLDMQRLRNRQPPLAAVHYSFAQRY